MGARLAVLIVLSLFVVACIQQPPAQVPVAPPPAEQAPPAALPAEPPSSLDPRCPASCDDQNSCTQDVCNQQTSFECRQVPIVPCCGNGVCEDPEAPESCSEDCTQESPEFKQLIVNSGKAQTFQYRYEYYDTEALQATYLVKIAGPYTLIEYDDLKHRGQFAYNRVFINQTSGTTTIYCVGSCGITTPARSLSGTVEFGVRKPTETLHGLTGVTVVGKENVEGKEATVLVARNPDNSTLRIKVWSFFGTPMVEELLDARHEVLERVRYRSLIVNGISEDDAVPPDGLKFE